MKRIASGSLLFLLSFTASAQPGSPSAFEVASVKPHELPRGTFAFSGASRESAIKISGNRVTILGTFTGLMLAAYKLRTFQLSGVSTVPDAAGRDQLFDVEARAPGDGAPTLDQAREMLQTLLADRFQLQFHRETKEMSVYDLVTGNNPPKLKPGTPDEESRTEVLTASSQLTRVRYTNVAIPELVIRVASMFDRPLFDKTGLAGGYDFTLEYGLRPDAAGMSAAEAAMFAGTDEGPSIVTAVQQQLGLKVVPAKEQVENLVIDRVEKPSAN